MDIHKVREEFESLQDIRGIIQNGFQFNSELNQYFHLDHVNHRLNYAFLMGAWMAWQASKAQAVPEQVLENDCMIGQTWFMKGTSVSALIKHAEGVYKAEAIAQNSKIEFGTDDNKIWWAHEVPFYGTVQLDRIEEHGFIEWDIHFNDCWQGPFSSKSKAIQHLEECIQQEKDDTNEKKNI